MGSVIRLPLDVDAFDRLTRHQINSNIAADREDWVRIARAVLRSPKYHPDNLLRDACATLQAWGNAGDYLEADAMIFALNKRERDVAHEIARRAVADETSVQIAMRHARRWPTILAGAGVWAAVMLALAGWL